MAGARAYPTAAAVTPRFRFYAIVRIRSGFDEKSDALDAAREQYGQHNVVTVQSEIDWQIAQEEAAVIERERSLSERRRGRSLESIGEKED